MCSAGGFYQLPFNHVCPILRKERGLAQGLSVSVRLAEIFVGLLVWKLSHVAQLETMCYIDDVNVITEAEEAMHRALEIIHDFEATFPLKISDAKSYLWGSVLQGLARLAEAWNLTLRDSVHCFGGGSGVCMDVLVVLMRKRRAES